MGPRQHELFLRVKNFLVRPHYILAMVALWLCLMPMIYLSGQRRTLETEEGLRQQIIINTEKIAEIEREIKDIRDWTSLHDRRMVEDNTAVQLSELKTTVAAHDRLLWLLISTCVLSVFSAIFSIVNRSKIDKVHESLNSRLSEMLAARGDLEHARGRWEGRQYRDRDKEK